MSSQGAVNPSLPIPAWFLTVGVPKPDTLAAEDIEQPCRRNNNQRPTEHKDYRIGFMNEAHKPTNPPYGKSHDTKKKNNPLLPVHFSCHVIIAV